MATGVQCKISPQCRVPAPADTRVCRCHQRQARAAALRQSPSAVTRVLGRALLTEHQAGARRAADMAAATPEERLTRIAGLLSECPAPDALAGYDQCAHGIWPCATTEAAWLAQGKDRGQELRKVSETLRWEALIQDANEETWRQYEAARREGRRRAGRPTSRPSATPRRAEPWTVSPAPSTCCTSTGPTSTPAITPITIDVQARLAEHETGRGARLLQVAQAAGITWTLARIWPGDRTRERQLKAQGGASRRCPQCGIKPRTTPGQQQEKIVMKKTPGRSATDSSLRRPEYVIELSVSPELRNRAQRTAAVRAQARRSTQAWTPEPEAGRRLADLEAEP